MRAHVKAVPLGTLVLLGCAAGSPNAPSPGPAPATMPPATMAPAPPSPAPSPAGAAVLRVATLRGANGHAASGTARLVRHEGGTFALELGGDFRIDSGNNDVYLTRGPDSPTTSDLNLGDMHSTRGFQSYALPHDGSDYTYVMLWCRPFRVPIGLGELR